jgi:hypothetical protein
MYPSTRCIPSSECNRSRRKTIGAPLARQYGRRQAPIIPASGTARSHDCLMILNKTLLATLLARGFLCPATTSRICDSSLLQYFFIVVTVFFHRCYSIFSSLLQYLFIVVTVWFIVVTVSVFGLAGTQVIPLPQQNSIHRCYSAVIVVTVCYLNHVHRNTFTPTHSSSRQLCLLRNSWTVRPMLSA